MILILLNYSFELKLFAQDQNCDKNNYSVSNICTKENAHNVNNFILLYIYNIHMLNVKGWY